jgi:hypothetical protein
MNRQNDIYTGDRYVTVDPSASTADKLQREAQIEYCKSMDEPWLREFRARCGVLMTALQPQEQNNL